jgi:hypothetical protein
MDYLAALDQEISEAKARLAQARTRLHEDANARIRALAAISDSTLEWLEAERDRLRAGGQFDEAAARSFLEHERRR